MKACIICFGDEILSGAVSNTNVSFLSKQLTELGLKVAEHITLSDFDQTVKELIKKLSFNYEVIICTGGLGPTIDDKTRELFASLAEVQIKFNQEVYLELVNKFGDEPYHKIQSMLPSGLTLLDNNIGTAKGLYLSLNKGLLFAIPGVPHEMRKMFLTGVIPIIQKELKLVKNFTKTICFFDLIEIQLDPYLKKLIEAYPEVKFGIYPSYGVVKVSFEGPDMMDIEAIQEYFITEFGSWIYACFSEKLEKVVCDYLNENKQTIALAESITGGDMARRFVSLPGVSSVFLGSFVTYSNQMKKNILEVSEETLNVYGAVSKQTAVEMLKGALKKSLADYAIAVTGIAGPTKDGSLKPIGLVYIAIGNQKGDYVVHECHFQGDREMIIEKSSTYALGYFLKFIKK